MADIATASKTVILWSLELGCVPEGHSEHQGRGTKGRNASRGGELNGTFMLQTEVVRLELVSG